MRLIKLALLSIVFLFLAATAVSLLIPSRVRISRAVNLQNPEAALKLVKDTSRWEQWHPAFMNDSLNRQEPITIEPVNQSDTSFVAELRQGDRRSFTNGWVLHHYAYSDSVTLQWYMDFQLKWYPWQKFGSLFFEGSFGKMMEEGLSNLERISSRQEAK